VGKSVDEIGQGPEWNYMFVSKLHMKGKCNKGNFEVEYIFFLYELMLKFYYKNL
jgi:hypothetical protein